MNLNPTVSERGLFRQWGDFPLRILLIVAAAITPGAVLHAQSEGQLSVGVRTQLDSQKQVWDGVHLKKLPDPVEHSKVYGILALQRAKQGAGTLVKPIDVAALQDELIRQLDSQGFHHAGPSRRPDILLIVVYGRAWLPNPYYSTAIDVDNMGPGSDPNPFKYAGADGNNPLNIPVDDPKIAARLQEPGVEEKASRSMFEKLFIMVRAWKNPTDPKEKPTALWVATMYVDDPENRDLNLIVKQMLEAGAPYFDKAIKGEEVEIRKPLPEGHVHVGTPEVVEPPKSKLPLTPG